MTEETGKTEQGMREAFEALRPDLPKEYYLQAGKGIYLNDVMQSKWEYYQSGAASMQGEIDNLNLTLDVVRKGTIELCERIAQLEQENAELKAELAALKKAGGEPVARFSNTAGKWFQVPYDYPDAANVFPLYFHAPPDTERQLAEAYQTVAQLREERQRDALLGQATLDEANEKIVAQQALLRKHVNNPHCLLAEEKPDLSALAEHDAEKDRQLAESLAREKVLREALTQMVAYAADMHCGLKLADDALAQPLDTSALDAMLIAAKREVLESVASEIQPAMEEDKITLGELKKWLLIKASELSKKMKV